MRSVAFAVALVFASAHAGDAPPPVSDWTPDEIVVVTAQGLGPAFWHIKKDASEIYILATVADIPAGTNFEDSHIAEVLKGARVVLLPPKVSSGFFSTAWFLLWNRSLMSMPDGKKLEETLPPDLRARYEAVLDGLKIPLNRFADDSRILAAMRLESAFADDRKLIRGGFEDTMEVLASKADVPVKRIADYDALGLAKELMRLPPPAQQACLTEAVTDIEQRTIHLGPLVTAWVIGDLKGVKAHYTPRPFWNCARATQNFGRLYERAVNDTLKAIKEALSKPGKSVLVTDIGPLLRETGVVEKLHSEGIIIEGPTE